MATLPITFGNAGNDAAHRQMQSLYGAQTPDEAAQRQAERVAKLDEQRLDYDISTMSADKAEGMGRIGNAASAVGQREALARENAKSARDNADTQVLLASIRAAEAMAAEAGRVARGYEADFENEFGTNWREDVALRVLDPDEFPLRGEGETQADYDARVEKAIIEKMIDPETGEIKDEYKDHPTLGRYAEWAKARNQELEAKAYIDAKQKPVAERTPEEQARVDKFEDQPAFDQAMQAQQEASLAKVDVAEIGASIDMAIDSQAVKADLMAGANAF